MSDHLDEARCEQSSLQRLGEIFYLLKIGRGGDLISPIPAIMSLEVILATSPDLAEIIIGLDEEQQLALDENREKQETAQLDFLKSLQLEHPDLFVPVEDRLTCDDDRIAQPVSFHNLLQDLAHNCQSYRQEFTVRAIYEKYSHILGQALRIAGIVCQDTLHAFCDSYDSASRDTIIFDHMTLGELYIICKDLDVAYYGCSPSRCDRFETSLLGDILYQLGWMPSPDALEIWDLVIRNHIKTREAIYSNPRLVRAETRKKCSTVLNRALASAACAHEIMTDRKHERSRALIEALQLPLDDKQWVSSWRERGHAITSILQADHYQNFLASNVQAVCAQYTDLTEQERFLLQVYQPLHPVPEVDRLCNIIIAETLWTQISELGLEYLPFRFNGIIPPGAILYGGRVRNYFLEVTSIHPQSNNTNKDWDRGPLLVEAAYPITAYRGFRLPECRRMPNVVDDFESARQVVNGHDQDINDLRTQLAHYLLGGDVINNHIIMINGALIFDPRAREAWTEGRLMINGSKTAAAATVAAHLVDFQEIYDAWVPGEQLMELKVLIRAIKTAAEYDLDIPPETWSLLERQIDWWTFELWEYPEPIRIFRDQVCKLFSQYNDPGLKRMLAFMARLGIISDPESEYDDVLEELGKEVRRREDQLKQVEQDDEYITTHQKTPVV